MQDENGVGDWRRRVLRPKVSTRALARFGLNLILRFMNFLQSHQARNLIVDIDLEPEYLELPELIHVD